MYSSDVITILEVGTHGDLSIDKNFFSSISNVRMDNLYLISSFMNYQSVRHG